MTDDTRTTLCEGPKRPTGAACDCANRKRALSALPLLLIALLLCGAGVLASSAEAADTLQVSVGSAAPEQGIPVPLEFSGTSEAVDSDGDGPILTAVIRPAGGIGCQADEGADHAAAGDVTTELIGDEDEFEDTRAGPGSYTEQADYDAPNTGQYLVCAWLESEDSVDAGPISATFSAAGPQVSQLTVAVPGPALPGVAFQVSYTTHTDQKLSLESVIRKAGGLPCAVNSHLDSEQNEEENYLLGGDYWEGSEVFGGPSTTSATVTEQTAGPYVVCTWIEGPDNGEVDAAASSSVYVGTPPAPAPSAPHVAHATSPHIALSSVYVSRRHGIAVRGRSAHSVLGKVRISVSCGRARVVGESRVAHGAFALQLDTPRSCRAGRSAHVSASWPGSRAFLRQSVSQTVEVKR